jgi:hypothetical protein
VPSPLGFAQLVCAGQQVVDEVEQLRELRLDLLLGRHGAALAVLLREGQERRDGGTHLTLGHLHGAGGFRGRLTRVGGWGQRRERKQRDEQEQ